MKERLKRTLAAAAQLARAESGQAMTEYAATTTILLMGGLAAGAAWPFTRALFVGLQLYVDLYFYGLNVAIG